MAQNTRLILLRYLSTGFTFLSSSWQLTVIPAGLLFILVSYFSATLIICLISLLLQKKNGIIILFLIVFLGTPFSIMLGSQYFTVDSMNWLLGFPVFRYFPAELAAHAMSDASVVSSLIGAILLLGWLILLLSVVRKIETFEQVGYSDHSDHISWENNYAPFAKLLNNRKWPLLNKALCYHLRCNKVRYTLFVAPMFIFLAKIMAKGNAEYFILISFLHDKKRG